MGRDVRGSRCSTPKQRERLPAARRRHHWPLQGQVAGEVDVEQLTPRNRSRKALARYRASNRGVGGDFRGFGVAQF